MKYIPAEVEFPNDVISKHNMRLAYKRLGEINPYKVKRHERKKSHRNIKLSDGKLIHLGMLNVRKRLNRHLGKSGKYTNTMLKKTAKVTSKIKNGVLYLGTSVPKDAYIKIVLETYLMLWQYDQACCLHLLSIEAADTYPAKETNQQVPTKALTPIQTNIYLRSAGRTEETEKFIKYLRERIIVCLEGH